MDSNGREREGDVWCSIGLRELGRERERKESGKAHTARMDQSSAAQQQHTALKSEVEKAKMERHAGEVRERRMGEEGGKHRAECFACTPGGHGAHHTHSELERSHPTGV